MITYPNTSSYIPKTTPLVIAGMRTDGAGNVLSD